MAKIAKWLLPLAFWLGLWQVVAVNVGQLLLLPSPLSVGTALLDLVGMTSFWTATAMTLLRVMAGLVLGALLGVLLAGLTVWLPVANWILTPAIKVVRATPVASFILVLWLWVSAGQVSGLIAGLMVLPVVWGNVSRGLQETDGQLLEMARSYGFGRWKTVRLVYAPSTLPYLASGCQTALGLAWKAGVAAEVLCQPKLAVGTQIFLSKNRLESPTLFAWTAVVIALSLVLERLLGGLLQGRWSR